MEDRFYHQLQDSPRPSLFAASGVLLLAAAGLWLSSAATLLLPGGGSVALDNLLYYLPFMLLPVAVAMRRRPGMSAALRLNPPPALPMLGVAMLALLSVYAASALASGWTLLLNAFGLKDIFPGYVPDSPRALTTSVLALAALPAVCEELLFRGFTLAAWETRGTRYAIGVSALLFALLHGNPFGLPAYLLVGALSGYLVFALDSLYAGIVYHTVYNAACLVIPYLLSGGEAAAEPAVDAAFVVALVTQLTMVLTLMFFLLAALRARRLRAGIEPIPRIRRPLEKRERWMLAAAVAVMLLSMMLTLWLGGAL